MSVQRYNVGPDYGTEATPAPAGWWVRWDDHERAMSDLEEQGAEWIAIAEQRARDAREEVAEAVAAVRQPGRVTMLVEEARAAALRDAVEAVKALLAIDNYYGDALLVFRDDAVAAITALGNSPTVNRADSREDER